MLSYSCFSIFDFKNSNAVNLNSILFVQFFFLYLYKQHSCSVQTSTISKIFTISILAI